MSGRQQICALLFAAVVLALPSAARAGGALFTCQTAAGKQPTGPLQKVAPDWTIELGGASGGTVNGSDLISLRRPVTVLPAPPTVAQVLLVGGDRIPLDLAKGLRSTTKELVVHPLAPVLAVREDEFSIPGGMVVGLWLRAPQGSGSADRVLRQLLRKPTADLMLLDNGDRVEGIFLGLEAGCTGKMKVGGKTVQIPFSRVAAVIFNPLFSSRLPKVPYGHAILADGGRLSLRSARLAPGAEALVGKTLFGADVRVTLKDIVAIDLYQGRAVYLSDLKPAAYANSPFFGLSWPLAADATVVGGGLQIGRDHFDKGLGMHTGSRVDYRLDGKYEWFEATVGLAAGCRGTAALKVAVDDQVQDLGKQQWSWQDPPQHIRIPVRNAKLLRLEADFGSGGDVQGHVNWVNARLLKPS